MLAFVWIVLCVIFAIIIARVVFVRVCVGGGGGGDFKIEVRFCLSWCFQISTSFGKNRLVHL